MVRRFSDVRMLFPIVIVAGVLLASLVIGEINLEPKILLIILLGIVTTLILSSGASELLLYRGYLVFIGTLIVGWRGLWVTTNLRFYSPEVLIWALFGVSLGQLLLSHSKVNMVIPKSVLILGIPIGLLGFIAAQLHNIPWDLVWAEYKDILLALPIFAVTYWAITDFQQWKSAIRLFIVITVGIAGLGILEYVTGRSLNIFGSTEVPALLASTATDFSRSAFSFWGHPSAVFLPIMALGFVIAPLLNPNTKSRKLYALALVLILGAVYVAGHRGGWIATAIVLLCVVMFDLGRRWVFVIPFILILFVLPDNFYENLKPLIYGTDQYYDSSLVNHLNYADFALSNAEASPLIGKGWGGSGWAHNDLLQLAGDAGFPAAIVFGAWYLFVSRQLFQIARRRLHDEDREIHYYATALLATLIGFIVALNTQVVIPLTPLVAGLWCLLALVVRFIQLEYASQAVAHQEPIPQEVLNQPLST